MTAIPPAVRHFIRDDDLSPAEQAEVLSLAARLKGARHGIGAGPLAGPRAVAVLFDKPSLRTRVSFAVGIAELGGMPLIIDAQSSQLSRGEPIGDTARVLGRQAAAIVWRTFGQDRIEEMAAASTVPVVNALTDMFHPCQILADLLTVQSAHGRLAGLTLAFLGDGASNMAHSYLLGGATAGPCTSGSAGLEAPHQPGTGVLACGRRRSPRRHRRQRCRCWTTLRRPPAAGADVLATDVWTSMGQEGEESSGPARTSALASFGLDEEKLSLAQPGAIVLHCLPAHRGEEISAGVLEGPQSAVWDQAENRLHAQKALLAWLIEGKSP